MVYMEIDGKQVTAIQWTCVNCGVLCERWSDIQPGAWESDQCCGSECWREWKLVKALSRFADAMEKQ